VPVAADNTLRKFLPPERWYNEGTLGYKVDERKPVTLDATRLPATSSVAARGAASGLDMEAPAAHPQDSVASKEAADAQASAANALFNGEPSDPTPGLNCSGILGQPGCPGEVCPGVRGPRSFHVAGGWLHTAALRAWRRSTALLVQP
jgi:hypothetical protein